MMDFLAGIICAILAAMGVGGGGLLVIYLTLVKDVPQLTAQGINLLFFLPSALISLVFKHKLFKSQKELILLICPVCTCSSLAFCLIGGFIDEALIRRIFGIFLIFAALLQIFSHKEKTKKNSCANNGKASGRQIHKCKRK